MKYKEKFLRKSKSGEKVLLSNTKTDRLFEEQKLAKLKRKTTKRDNITRLEKE